MQLEINIIQFDPWPYGRDTRIGVINASGFCMFMPQFEWGRDPAASQGIHRGSHKKILMRTFSQKLILSPWIYSPLFGDKFDSLPSYRPITFINHLIPAVYLADADKP